MPAIANENVIAGPAFVAAACPVRTKMPAPTIAPTPSTMTSNVPRLRRSLWDSSSVLVERLLDRLAGPEERRGLAARHGAPGTPRDGSAR